MGKGPQAMAESEKRIGMARAIARRWLEDRAKGEYRFKVYSSGANRNLPGLLKAFRDGKTLLSDVPPIPDLGIQTGFDYVSVWSGNRVAMVQLNRWLEDQGMATTGIW